MEGVRTARGPLLSPAGDGTLAIGDAWVEWDPDTGVLTRVGEAGPTAPAADLDVRGVGLILPGFVDAHVHFPQHRVAGRFADALLPWLREHIWPEEVRYGDPAVAAAEAPPFLAALAAAGTTPAAVYGSPPPPGVEPLLAATGGPAVIAGPALMDREGPDALLLPAAEAERAMDDLAARHGDRVVVTPRFAVSCTAALLEACGRVAAAHDLRIQTHLSENPDEIALVARQFPGAADYLDVYAEAGLLGPRTLLAHAVHCSDDAFRRLRDAGATVVHCPTSNLALGSGRMPLERLVVLGVPVCLGSDVGAGPDLCLLDVLRACVQLHGGRHRVDAAGLLPLATTAGARALGYADRGFLAPGARADLIAVATPTPDPDPALSLDQVIRSYETSSNDRILWTVCGGQKT